MEEKKMYKVFCRNIKVWEGKATDVEDAISQAQEGFIWEAEEI